MKKRNIFIFEKKKRKKIIKIVEYLVLGFLILLFSFLSLSILAFIYYAGDLPRPEKFTEKTFIKSTKIFDRTGEILLYEMYGEEKREIVSLSEIPEHLKQAVLAAEDADFYSHFGIDMRGIMRSVLINLKIKQPTYGGSTITQQLIRSSFLTQEKTIVRKVREIILALELERKYEKEEILEWYLNQIPFGPNVYGVESASKYFFSKPVNNISLEESSILAALIQAPGRLSMDANKEDLIARQNYVLNRMEEEGYISEEEKKSAKEKEIQFTKKSSFIRAPHFVIDVQEELLKKYGRDFLEKEGLKIYTTLDMNLQEIAEKAVKKGVERNKSYNANNAALVAMDPKTGQILSMVGSADWFSEPYPANCQPGKSCLFDPEVNVATYGMGRQPGSSFKPFVYASAFEKGYTDSYIVVDEETNFGIYGGKPYIPQNYDGLFRGPVTLREALAQSLNIPSVKVLVYLSGLEEGINMAKKLGITTLTRESSFYGPSIVLGGGEVRLLDMVASYGVFANNGLKVPPVSILRIEDSEGNILEENKSNSPQRVIKASTAETITSILSDNVSRSPVFGPNSRLYFPFNTVAVKTGTTNEYKDGWTIGYTSSIVVGVWTGNSNNIPMRNADGIVVAAPIWREFMDTVLK
ncbi:MAG: PBP1A family penicillin-binding protein [Candidatus Pacebacteria bacterium]|nr:PBP1A family penicillin-binding protein [Candidatus Paceibacterota bacterium]MDD3072579.1 PBP1A family penicillin-binding protein [Candidatus Paceibacterota bacterium]MDD4201730.1 PBP1A family penicillin-binding protein [Candidatus Paceibacterota bacterium]MDD4467235.1 PBP1A family penicillin-binding protein [Candidatus Paceibacterota bacterium]